MRKYRCPKKPDILLDMRINQYLSVHGYCSRRMADHLVSEGKVRVNGKLAVIGQQVSDKDVIEVDKQTARKISTERIYLAFYKNKGIDTHAVPKLLKKNVFPVGRLDKNSRGLIILTNDGRITDKLLNPKYDHEKEYLVEVDKKLRPGFLQHMREGIKIDDYVTRPANVTKLADNKFRIILTEGRHHQIRRMCDAFGYTVRDLKRVRIMHLTLGNLQPGKARQLQGSEREELLKSLGL